MPPLSPAAFRERLATLAPAERAALVAALYRARGRTARVDGRRVRLDDGPRSRILYVGRDPPADADGVVVAVEDGNRNGNGNGNGNGDGTALAPESDDPVDVVDADDLRELLLYGVAPEDGDRVAREHLGVPLRSTQYARRVDGGDGSGSTGGAGSGSPAPATRGTDRRGGPTTGAESAPVGTGFGTDRTGDRLRDRLRAVVAGDRSVVPDAIDRPTRRIGAVAVLAAALVLAAAFGGAGVGTPLLGASDGGNPGSAPSGDAGVEGSGPGSASPSPSSSSSEPGAAAGSATVEPYAEPTTARAGSEADPERGSGSASGAGDGAGVDDPPDGVSGENVTADDEARLAGDASRGVLPPGVGLDGDVDASALAAAHGRVLADRSYTLVITHREFRDGRPTALRREVARVADDREYVSAVTRIGETTATVQTVADVERYANGSVRATRPADDRDGDAESTRLARTDPADPFRERSVRYVRWFASVRNSAVVEATERDGRVHYWLSLADDPWPGVANSTGSLLVDERGLVHSIRRSYDVPDRPGVSVVVTVEVTNVGETTVTRPAWYPDRRAGGNDSSVPDVSAAWAGIDAGGARSVDWLPARNATHAGDATRTRAAEGATDGREVGASVAGADGRRGDGAEGGAHAGDGR